MTKPDETAYPFDGEIDGELRTWTFNTGMENEFSTTRPDKIKIKSLGLTKREYFAAMAMQGMLANSQIGVGCHILAVEMADQLIKQLNKTEPQ